MNEPGVVILGFMGCGKTAVARELALLRNQPWVDLDQRIEEQEGRSPKQIIIEDGETAFRETETRVLRKLLANGERIIALGGGAWTVAVNREILQQHGSVAVWLDTPFEICWKRIAADGQSRPLAPTREIAQKLYSDRREIYSLADLHVSVGDEPAVAVSKRIAALLR